MRSRHILIVAAFILAGVHGRAFSADDCGVLLEFGASGERAALATLRRELPLLSDAPLDSDWFQLLENYVYPSLQASAPLLAVAIVGGGNAGKSTLFNSIPGLLNGDARAAGQPEVSRSGLYPGLTRRMTVMMSTRASRGVLQELRSRFGTLEPWRTAEQTTLNGPALFLARDEIPRGVVFYDTPDFDTGGPGSAEPDNLPRLRRLVQPADILFLLADAKSVRNLANLQTLARFFKSYGDRPMILGFLADPSARDEEIRELLAEFANALYGGNGEGFPSKVLAAYRIPYSSDVPMGLASPRLVPLAGFREFPGLVRSLEDSVEDIRELSHRTTLGVIMEGAYAVVRERLKRRLALKLYSAAIDVFAENAARESTEPFPYARTREAVRAKFFETSSAFAQYLHQAGSLIAMPEKALAGLVTGWRGDALGRLHLEPHLEVQRAIGTMLAYFRGRDVPPQSRDLLARLHRFYLLYPEELKREGALPSSELLPADLRSAFDRIAGSETADVTSRFASQLERAQRHLEARVAPADLFGVVGSLHARDYRMRAALEGALDMATLIAPAASVLALNTHGVDNSLILAAAAVMSARPIRSFNDFALDRFLSRELDSWYVGEQSRITKEFLLEVLAAELREAGAESRSDNEIVPLSRIQSALAVLSASVGGGSYPAIPTE